MPGPGCRQWVGCVDLAPNEEADVNVLVRPTDSWEEQMTAVLDGVEGALAGEKLDAIFCVAGGWAGGSAKAKGEPEQRAQASLVARPAARIPCSHQSGRPTVFGVSHVRTSLDGPLRSVYPMFAPVWTAHCARCIPCSHQSGRPTV